MGFFERYQKVLDTCLSVNTLGETALYLPAGADPSVVPILFAVVPSREALEISLGDMTSSRARKTTLGVSLSRLKEKNIEPKEGDSIRWREMDFELKTVITDGEGGAVLVLRKPHGP